MTGRSSAWSLAALWLALLCTPASAFAETSAPELSNAKARERLEDGLSRALAEPAFAYCRDVRQAAWFADSEVCQLARAPARQRCPALAEACASPRAAPEREPDRPTQTNTWFNFPSWLGTILFWSVLALLALGLARLIWPLLESLAPTPEPVRQPAAGTPSAEPQAPRAAQESDVERLLAHAERARSAGLFEQAVAALYGALVHSLGREQLITVEAARTNGDYLRELAPKPDLQSAVRRAFRAVERVQFGRGQATAELCSELWACVLPIVRRSAALLVLLLLPLALGACSQIRRPASDFGPSGNHLFTKLMQDGGTRVRKLIRAQVDEDVSQLLVLGREASPEAWQMALSFAVDGGSVVVTEPSQGLLRELYVEIERGAPCARSLEVPQAQGSTALSVVGPGQRYLRIAPDTEREGSARPRVDASCAGKAYVATFAYGDGYLTLLANRELLENLSLSVADNAAFTLGLFGPPGGTLGVVGLWTGGGVDSPLSALKNAGLGPVLLALLALLFALLWHLGAAFGTRRDPSDPARRAFADHVRALGRNYARAGARRQALAQYAAYALEVLRERFGRGAPLGLIALSGEVARRSGRAESDVMQLLVEAHEVAQSQDAERGVASDLKTIEQLEILLYPSGGTK